VGGLSVQATDWEMDASEGHLPVSSMLNNDLGSTNSPRSEGERPGRSQGAGEEATTHGRGVVQQGDGSVGSARRRLEVVQFRVWDGWAGRLLRSDSASRVARPDGRHGLLRRRHASTSCLWLVIVILCFAGSAGQFYPPPNVRYPVNLCIFGPGTPLRFNCP
jgi:hypothetical protein